MEKRTEYSLEDLAKISGGELGPQVQEYIFFVIGVAKTTGETTDSLIERMHANGCSQETIDFVMANW